MIDKPRNHAAILGFDTVAKCLNLLNRQVAA